MVQSLTEARVSLSSKASRKPWGCTQLPLQWVLGALSWWVMQPECEADHSPLSTAKVKNE